MIERVTLDNPLGETNGRIILPRECQPLKFFGISIASLRPEHLDTTMSNLIFRKELGFTQEVVGPELKKQMAHIVFEIIDVFNPAEKPYSDWNLGIAEGKVKMIAMVRRGREHQRERHHCKGPKEFVTNYLAALPSLFDETRQKVPDEIALALEESQFSVEELNYIFRDQYKVDPTSVATYVRAYTDPTTFEQVEEPNIPAHVSIRKINNKRISQRARERIRAFYREVQGDAYSFKSRSLGTPGAYFDAFSLLSNERLGIAGIIAQDNTNDVMPISMGGDLAVAEAARRQGIGLALRYVSYASVFNNPVYRNGIITTFFLEKNEGSRKIFLDHLKCVDVSRSLWVVLKKI